MKNNSFRSCYLLYLYRRGNEKEKWKVWFRVFEIEKRDVFPSEQLAVCQANNCSLAKPLTVHLGSG